LSRRGFGFAIGAAVLVAAALIVASLLGAGDTSTTRRRRILSRPRSPVSLSPG
jgi:hypothetical protein